MNIKAVFKILSYILLFIGAIMLIPAAMALAMGEYNALKAFLKTEILLSLFSFVAILITRKTKILDIRWKDSYLLVTLIWILAAAFGALPLYFEGTTIGYSESFFEIMSGFTTTGATALLTVEDHPMSIIFWRCLTNWLGGMGIVVLFVAILPIFGVKGSALIAAESVGPTKDKLTPKARMTALTLWLIYIAISAIMTILLLFGGLPLYDALTVMFGTMGAAGFTATNLSIESYNSPYVEWICIIFMFIAGGNFALYYKIIKRKMIQVKKDGELRLYAAIVTSASLLIALNLFFSGLFCLSDSIRHAFFQVVSVITTTGFYSTDFNLWPTFSIMIMFLLMFVGGSAGSTGGGIKVIRILIMFKMAKNALLRRNHPNAVTNITVGYDKYDSQTCLSIAGFVGLYIATAIIGAVILSLSNMDFITCLTSSLQAIGNIGFSLGGMGVSRSFHEFSAPFQWVLSILMLVGRLELFTVLSLFSKRFWK